MIKTILWDLDGTLLDFIPAERHALKKCFEVFGIGKCTDDAVARYSEINKKYWHLLEKGVYTKSEILRKRFEEFFASEKIDFSDIDLLNEKYQLFLAEKTFEIDNCTSLLPTLGVKNIIVTNGTKVTSQIKLKNSGLDKVVDAVFISEEVGFEKPDKRIFDCVLKSIPDISKDEIIFVGDSPNGDICGAMNSGLKSCFYNPAGVALPKGIVADFEIKNLGEISQILKIL